MAGSCVYLSKVQTFLLSRSEWTGYDGNQPWPLYSETSATTSHHTVGCSGTNWASIEESKMAPFCRIILVLIKGLILCHLSHRTMCHTQHPTQMRGRLVGLVYQIYHPGSGSSPHGRILPILCYWTQQRNTSRWVYPPNTYCCYLTRATHTWIDTVVSGSLPWNWKVLLWYRFYRAPPSQVTCPCIPPPLAVCHCDFPVS